MGDLNEDDHLDLVVANSGMDNIGIFLNYHNATFTPQITYSTPVGSHPYSLALSHFNNDTHLDIVVAFFGINSLGVLLGYGNGHFDSSIVTSLGSSRPLSLAVGHFNYDSIFDVVVANYGTSTIAILLGTNDGSFRIDSIYEIGYDSIPYFVTVGHLNDDDRLDIIVANHGTSELAILLTDTNYNSFTLKKYPTGCSSYPSSVTTSHFNDDNIVDVAVAYSGSDNIGIFVGHGNGSFTDQMTYSIGSDARAEFISVGDFNNDTHIDIVVADSKHDNIVIFKGFGNGSFSTMTRHSTGYNSDPCAMVVGDFDDDHQLDVAIVNHGTNNLLILASFLIYPNTSQTQYIIGNNTDPYNIDIADFNEDTYPDIVVCNEGTNGIRIFLNLGNGTLDQENLYIIENSSQVNFVVAADVNNDGHLDVVAALNNESGISVLLGYGNGTLFHADTFLTANDSFIYRIVVADLNNDGSVDIITSDPYTGYPSLYFGFGNGMFNTSAVFFDQFAFKPYFVQASDVNADLILDIAVCYSRHGCGIAILLGYGNGSFHRPLFVSTDDDCPNTFIIGDLNSDRRSDIVYTSTSSAYVGVMLGRGDGTFENPTKYFCVRGSRPWSISLEHYNDDAFIDIAVTLIYDSSISVYLGFGNGSFEGPTRISIEKDSVPIAIRFADFDNDGQQDIAVASGETNTLQIFLVHYDADFTIETSYTTGSNSHPVSVSAGDLNDDGQWAIVVANSGTDNLELFFHYDNDVFINRTSLSTGLASYPHSVTIADFNRDHFMDIAVVNAWHDTMIVFLGSGNESFVTRNVYSTGVRSSPKSIVAGDLNSDGRTDVVIANPGSNDFAVFLAFDYISFTNHLINVPGMISMPFFIITNDFNNDHLLDIAIVNIHSATLGIYLGYGNGTFSDQITYSTGPSSSPFSLASGDLNDDNCIDVVVANTDSSTISIFFGYCNGSFQSPISYSTGSSTEPYSVAVADFNQDHHLDIVVTVGGNVDEHKIWVFLGSGDGSFRGVIGYSMNNQTNPVWVAVDDVNKDAIPDIVVANKFTDNVCILFGYGNGSFGHGMTLFTGDDSGPTSIALGDLNGDDAIDIVVASHYSNTILLFFGDGNGSFFSPKTYVADSNADLVAVIVSDINNDTILDILVCDYNRIDSSFAILYGFGDGNFTLPKIYPTGLNSQPFMLATGDFNSDGRVDLAINYFNQDRIGVFIQVSSEPFGSSSSISTGDRSHPESVVLADLNNDHRLDIVATNSAGDSISIYFGYGNGEFADQLMYSIGTQSFPSSITADHLNDDDYVDIALVSAANDNVIILLGCGNGSFIKISTYSTGLRSIPVSVVAKDLNRDNRSDVVVANRGSNEVVILVGLGNGSFIEAKRYSIGYDSRPQSVAVADVNNDDMLDIIVASYGSGHIEILLQTC